MTRKLTDPLPDHYGTDDWEDTDAGSMTTISDERLAEIVGAGVPCVPIEPWEVAHVVQELRSLRSLSSLEASPAAQGGVRVPSAEDIEQIICSTEPRSMTAAGDTAWTKRMAEALHARLSSLEASPAPVSEEMVEAGLEYYSEGGCSGLDSYERREVVRNIIEAALAAKGGQ